MIIDSLASQFTIGLVQYASHTLVNSPWETHPDGQDKSSLQLGGDALITTQKLLFYSLKLTILNTFE